jgi:hypothetical protein
VRLTGIRWRRTHSPAAVALLPRTRGLGRREVAVITPATSTECAIGAGTIDLLRAWERASGRIIVTSSEATAAAVLARGVVALRAVPTVGLTGPAALVLTPTESTVIGATVASTAARFIPRAPESTGTIARLARPAAVVLAATEATLVGATVAVVPTALAVIAIAVTVVATVPAVVPATACLIVGAAESARSITEVSAPSGIGPRIPVAITTESAVAAAAVCR